MSEQADALNKVARERGVPVDSAPPALPGMEPEGRPDLPWVQLPRNGTQLRPFSQNIGAIVGANGLYRRELVPVTIDPESGRIEDMDPERFQTYVENQLVPFSLVSAGKAGMMKQPESMKVTEARACLRSDSFRYPLRRLMRVNQVRQPVIRKDGRLELLPRGYDGESEIFTLKDAIDYPEDWSLEAGVCFLRDFLKEFPFANERSRAAHITAMVAMYGASLQPMASKRLNFLYRANNAGAGKGLLAHTAICGPCGLAMVQSIPDSKEEFKKILDTEALNGSAYIFLDEIERKLVNRTLNSFMTANMWSGRLMNSQKKFAVPQTSIVFMTGNNVELSGDLARRCLVIDLYVSEADAQARPIEHVMDEVYLAKPDVRADVLAALWALVRAWNEVKPLPRPMPSNVFRGFEIFSNIFGGVVQNAGFENPMQSTVAEVDPDYADMMAVVIELMKNVERKAEFEFNDIIEVCRELNAFEWHLEGKIVKGKRTESVAGIDGSEYERELEYERFELTAANKSWFGRLFSLQYGGTVFVLPDGRRVRFGKFGKNRARRYILEIVETEALAIR
jgi:hypothetical protein